ncbi:MAG: DinB family protein [Bacteroidetes bacterium]|nr:DinB family protein [Bacteroidota bacterium]
MELSALLKDYSVFNAWANHEFAEWFRPQNDALFEQHITNSFSSVRATILHIYAAENVWFNRLQGVVTTHFLSEIFEGSNAVLLDEWLDNSRAFRDFLLQQPDAYFAEMCDYKDLAGNPYTQVRAEMLLHAIQHSTFHRGQLVTLGRQLGMEKPPRTDYIFYTRIREKLK